ncbi:Fic family protein [Ruania suaedae]|uniref:Fic family protein n=1 Tax=Ruania suaedae TaxID=2897774 RepID=UPI001E5E0D1F|nr:Fic family protein [Ruania suaedae]UFU03880.1 Fic family protein [Ruania suaedae]
MDSHPASGTWPALQWEERVWTPAGRWGVQAANRGREQRYRAAVPALVADLSPALSMDVARAARDAALELSRLDAELGRSVSSFAPVLLRSEAASSSQIEMLTASARAIFSADLGIRTGRNAEQIAANTRMLESAVLLADDISAPTILRMHRVLMDGQTTHVPGRWRDEAVWVGTRTDSPVGAEYVAPHHSRLSTLIDDLVVFAAREDLSPVVHLSLVHAQFETIHPFSDGNGRTGRALAQAMLRHAGVTRNLAIPVSAGLLADVEGYHRALTAYRAGDPEPIVLAFTDAIARAVANSRTLVAELEGVRARWESRLRVRRDSHAWRLLDVAARRPVLSAAMAAEELGVQQPNVYPPLRALTDAGILTSKREHRLGPFWRADEVLAAVDSFAERAGRRERG